MYTTPLQVKQHTQCTYNVAERCVRATIVAVELQQVLHNMCVCIFTALGIQHAIGMRHNVICGLPHSAFCHIIS